MKVQELIDSLNKIKDKSSTVYYLDKSYEEYFSIDDIKGEDSQVLLSGKIMPF